jgi:hypothetical protein
MIDCNLPSNYTIIDAPDDSDSISSCRVIDGSLSLLFDYAPSVWPSDEASVDLGDVATIEGDLVIYPHERPDKTTVTAEKLSAIDGGLTILLTESSSSIDDFAVSFPAIETVGSDYVIMGGFKNLEISHSKALTVEGMLRVNGIESTDLVFPGVATVKEDLSIDSNTNLESLQMDALTTEEKGLGIQNNNKLEDVSLAKLKTVKGDITVYRNAALTVLELPALESAGTISVTENGADAVVSFPRLTSLGGHNGTSTSEFKGISQVHFASLSKVNGALSFQSTSLEDLTIPLLKTLNGSITVEDNPSLTTLALPRTSTVGDIHIESNEKLTNFTANALKTVGTVSISGNALLENVEFFGLEEVKGDFEVKGADSMDCSWFDQHIKSITRGKYFCKGDHGEKERKSSTGGIEHTEGNPEDYMTTIESPGDGKDEGTGSAPSDNGSDEEQESNAEEGGSGSGGLSTGAMAGIAVAIGLFAGIIALGIVFFIRRKRKRAGLQLPDEKRSHTDSGSEADGGVGNVIIINTSSGSSTSVSSPRDGPPETVYEGDPKMLGVHTKIEANIRVGTFSTTSSQGFFDSVSNRALDVGFGALETMRRAKDRLGERGKESKEGRKGRTHTFL